jgi:hypothetical protein
VVRGLFYGLRNRWNKFRGKPYYVERDGFSIGGVLSESKQVIDGIEFEVYRVEFKPFTMTGQGNTREEMEGMGWNFS